MPGDDAILAVDQNRIRPPEFPDAGGELRHLSIVVGARNLQIMQEVLAIPPERWSALRTHARATRLIQPYDEAALRAACGEIGRSPNEAQARRLLALVQRTRETGLAFPEMPNT
jgi:hypothetical protein